MNTSDSTQGNEETFTGSTENFERGVRKNFERDVEGDIGNTQNSEFGTIFGMELNEEFGEKQAKKIRESLLNPSISPNLAGAILLGEIARELLNYFGDKKCLVWFVTVGIMSSLNGGLDLIMYTVGLITRIGEFVLSVFVKCL